MTKDDFRAVAEGASVDIDALIADLQKAGMPDDRLELHHYTNLIWMHRQFPSGDDIYRTLAVLREACLAYFRGRFSS